MLTVSIIGQKGGSGKSTLACHLAVEAAASGRVTAAIDADPQKSLFNWYERREAEAPQVTRETDAEELKKLAKRAAAGGCEILIIDTSGRAEACMREAAEIADLILVPTVPEKFDLETLPTVQKVVKFAEKQACAFVVRNRFQPLAYNLETREERTVREGLTDQGWQVSPIVLHVLKDYTRCLNDGRTAQEFDPAGRAAGEVRALFQWMVKETKHG
jgi:chromosome partitioning protein